jgi:hypothetical protein
MTASGLAGCRDSPAVLLLACGASVGLRCFCWPAVLLWLAARLLGAAYWPAMSGFGIVITGIVITGLNGSLIKHLADPVDERTADLVSGGLPAVPLFWCRRDAQGDDGGHGAIAPLTDLLAERVT